MSATDFGNADFVFTDNELTELLGVIEQNQSGGADLDILDYFQSDANQPLALQFQPHDDQPPQCQPIKQEADMNGHSAFSSALASPCEPASLQTASLEPQQPAPSSHACSLPILPMPLTSALGAFALPGPLLGALPQAQPHPAASAPLSSLPIASMAMSAALTRAHSNAHAAVKAQLVDSKGQVSHSTVEKQRRDRINSLIDELRELVPPQQPRNAAAAAAEALEARRPKHVVLADTITLLRQLQQKLQISGLEQNATSGQGKPDENSEGGNSKGSASQEEMEVAGAPQIPFIPCQLTQNAGVTVERGPDCYYVQVKCRDRKGLLFDIIKALKMLPLEVRTAAVTTTGDGTVRDVFEVKLDDQNLTPEEVQNLVHDALFQQFNPAAAAAVAAASAYADVIALAAKRQRA